jgi:hypothetical protein
MSTAPVRGINSSSKVVQEEKTKEHEEDKKSSTRQARIAAVIAFFLVILVSQHSIFVEGTEEKSAAVAAVPVVTQGRDLSGTVHKLILIRGEPPASVRVPGGWCLDVWGEDPDGHAFTMKVRDSNSAEWLTWKEYQKMYPGRGAAWRQFKPTGQSAVVQYEFFRMNSQCR